MLLKDIRQEYYSYSASFSRLIRQLGFAGIALVWLFSGPQTPGRIAVPDDLTRVGLLLVVGLGFDFLHYGFGTAFWGALGRLREKKHGADPDRDVGDAPQWINWPALVSFWLKAVFMATAYVLLGFALWQRIEPLG